MLAADKQLLDAHLRDQLQQLRRIELDNIINRFECTLTPSTLIAGFCFTAIVELDIVDYLEPTKVVNEQRDAEKIFYCTATAALALSLYVTAVATMGIIFGQRLVVQATAEQGVTHDRLLKELNMRFIQCTVALGISMICVVIAAICVVWVKQAASDGTVHVTTIAVSSIVGVIFLLTVFTLIQMFTRLHTWTPASSRLALKPGAGSKSSGPPSDGPHGAPPGVPTGMNADEFYLDEAVRKDVFERRAAAARSAQLSEASSLLPSLPCTGREGKPRA